MFLILCHSNGLQRAYQTPCRPNKMINIFPLSDMLQLLQPFFFLCDLLTNQDILLRQIDTVITGGLTRDVSRTEGTAPAVAQTPSQDMSKALPWIWDLHRDMSSKGRGELGCTAKHTLAFLQQLEVTFCFVLQAPITVWLVLCSFSCFLPDINKWD